MNGLQLLRFLNQITLGNILSIPWHSVLQTNSLGLGSTGLRNAKFLHLSKEIFLLFRGKENTDTIAVCSRRTTHEPCLPLRNPVSRRRYGKGETARRFSELWPFNPENRPSFALILQRRVVRNDVLVQVIAQLSAHLRFRVKE